MKVKALKTCRNKGCNNEFKLYRTTDKYCSPQCAFDNAPKGKPQQTNIKPYSERRRRESYKYRNKRKAFLSKPENIACPVAKVIFKECLVASEIHHKAGRKGKLLNYVPYWLAVSRKGHNWIHDNPLEAIKLGFLIKSSTVNI